MGNQLDNRQSEIPLKPIEMPKISWREQLQQQMQDLSKPLLATESAKLFQHYNERAADVRNKTSHEIQKLRQDFQNITVTRENFVEVKSRIAALLEGPEQIAQNIDLQKGDRFVWNAASETMMIVGADKTLKFSIRFLPYSRDEQAKIDAIQPEESREKMSNPGKILGDWLVRRGPFPGRKNSCGASCGKLLEAFGLRSVLPQSGRDGKNWDKIIENYASAFFDKVPVNHPDDAPEGSVVVFKETARLGSAARKAHGHVEIKGSDGMFYSYYRSRNAAGSSRTSERDPAKYRTLTGFTGYAYVYNGKPLPDRRARG